METATITKEMFELLQAWTTTPWVKWDRDSIFAPTIGEWCLWSMVVKGQRNYFSGSLIEIEGKLFLNWDGFTSLKPDNTVYYARVSKLEDVPHPTP